jgi:hypothetical protein
VTNHSVTMHHCHKHHCHKLETYICLQKKTTKTQHDEIEKRTRNQEFIWRDAAGHGAAAKNQPQPVGDVRSRTAEPVTHASHLLAKLLVHSQTLKKRPSLPAPVEGHWKQQRQELESLIRENQFQQLKLQKKIAAVVSRQAAQLRTVQRIEFVSGLSAKNGKQDAGHQAIADYAGLNLQTDHSGLLSQLERRLKMLVYEQELLEEELQEIALRLENE